MAFKPFYFIVPSSLISIQKWDLRFNICINKQVSPILNFDKFNIFTQSDISNILTFFPEINLYSLHEKAQIKSH